ncbi:hypothetical protein TVAGG3_0399600 [Trichomonas vaginalis G3]|uniref:hypothetical protein n=1 Tax=Trichomonas vaginalis (strain ATCC PRA-98 / G3) TaxID=412133 RepID=UPI0021E58ED2|nr:hypothetical protein TVAGG3_0399600 [Trichomonas vaginalis G3]KAI5534590.1 hypothetical protein TVAGG3_0399600 [Trichomonas vaginalis G3]
MFSILLAQLSLSVSGKVVGDNSYMIYDKDGRENYEIIKEPYTKVRIDGVTKNIKEATDLGYSVEIYNDENSDYVIISQTITNKGSTEKKIDLCTALNLKDSIDNVEASSLTNFGYYLWWDQTNDLTLVLQNHPWVTDISAQDFGIEPEPRFFTNNEKILEYDSGFPEIQWISFSWLNKYIQPGKSITLSYMFYEETYQPPLLKLDKSLISEETDSTEVIQVKGSFYFLVEPYTVEAGWEIHDSKDKIIKYGSLGKFTVSEKQTSMDFDVSITPPTELGKYTLYVYTYTNGLGSLLYEEFTITVVPPNYRPKLYIVPSEYLYYIPDSEVSFLASVYDQDSGDKPLTAKVFFNNAEVATQEVANSKDLKTFKFKVPKDTAAGEYEVKVTATDGKKIGTKKFTITIKNNTVLTIYFEPKLNATYNKGDKVNFTAVINDPDTNFDNKFTVSLFYNDKVKKTITSTNDAGLVRVPLDFTIPTTETNTTAEIKIVVTTPTESSEKLTNINIYQDVIASDSATGKIATKEAKKKTALVAVLCVLAVTAVVVAVVVIILWLRK